MSDNVFDDKAATWDDDPAKVERAKVVSDAVRSTLPLSADTRMLEYGAGTGLVSQFLADHVGPLTLVDTSAGMRDVMHGKIDAGVLPTSARVWDLDLDGEPVDVDEHFDLVLTVLTLHHVHDLDAALANMAALLDAGGHLAIADLDEEDGTFHDGGFGGHHGFDHGRLGAALERAGFTDVAFRPCHHIVKHGHEYPVFLATAGRR